MHLIAKGIPLGYGKLQKGEFHLCKAHRIRYSRNFFLERTADL